MNIQKKIISRNYTVGRANQIPHIVVIHTTDGFGKNNFNWFNNPESKASAHFGVMLDGTVEQYVDIDNTAWHAGNWNINLISIWIEHDDNRNPNDSIRTEELYRSSIQLICFLIEELEKKYPKHFKAEANQSFINNFIRLHKEFANKSCPGGLNVDKIKNGVLEFLLNRNLNVDFNQMKKQIENLQKQINELNEQISILLNQKINLETDVSSLQSLNLALLNENKLLTEKQKNLNEQIQKKENTLISIENGIEKQKKVLNDLKNLKSKKQVNFLKVLKFLFNFFKK